MVDAKKTRSDPPTPITDAWRDVRSASDLSASAHLKVLLTGASGAGKTRCAARFKRPLYGLTEIQAVPTIRAANPDAVLYHGTDGQVGIRTVHDLRRFVLMARRAGEHGCDGVVLDTLTDAQRILRDWYTSRQGGRAGTEKTSKESWGSVVDSTARLAREMRDLPSHVIVICLDREETVDDLGIVHRPAISGKNLPNDLSQYFNACGFVHVVDVERGHRHQVLFRGGGERYLVKGLDGMDDLEPPEPRWWLRAMGGDGGSPDPAIEAAVSAWRALAAPVNDTESEHKEEDDDA